MVAFSQPNLSARELLRVIKVIVEAYYSEAQILDKRYELKRASKLAMSMKEYLKAFNS
jgi:hypothetical protein